MFWRSVAAPIQFGVIGFILFENVVDGSQQHPCNGNDGFFVTPALFKLSSGYGLLGTALPEWHKVRTEQATA